MNNALPTLLLCLLPLAACAEPVEGEIPSTSTSTLRQLQEGADLTLLPSTSTMTLDARWNVGSEWTRGSVELSVESGHIALSADDLGTVEVADIEIVIGDVLISSDLLPSDIQLTDVSVHQNKARQCDVNDWSPNRETCSAWLQTSLVLDWSLVTATGVVPLGAQELVDIPMQMDLSRGARGLQADLQVEGEGTLWSWADVIELHGLQLHIAADEIGPVD